MEFVQVIVAAIAGLLAGGIVNILADDLPDDEEGIHIRAPHYPGGSPRPWLGVLAFLSGKRAAPDGTRLSWRYPAVEVALAASFAALVLYYPFGAQLLFYLFYAFWFMLITVIDIEHRLILFVTIIPAVVVALIDAAFVPNPAVALVYTPASTGVPTDVTFTAGGAPTLLDGLIGGAAGFGVFWLFWYGGVIFNKARAGGADPEELEVAFGFGDVLLALVCGSILGWRAMLFAIFITVFAGAVGGVIWMVSRMFSSDGYALFTALPYGPYVVFGAVVMLFFKDLLVLLLFPAWIGLG
ncbi:MAG: prepilin peptidase [Anaerolineae bacterium]|nr:prepilin peptidase [Anaerolineae bacterium]